MKKPAYIDVRYSGKYDQDLGAIFARYYQALRIAR